MTENPIRIIENRLTFLLEVLFPAHESIAPTHLLSTTTSQSVPTSTRVGLIGNRYIALTVDLNRQIAGYCVIPAEEFPFIKSDNRVEFRNQRGIAYLLRHQANLGIELEEILPDQQY